jgi:hypothetical protein
MLTLLCAFLLLHLIPCRMRKDLEGCMFRLIGCIHIIVSEFYVSWVLANITSESSHCFRKGNRNSGRRLCIMVCPSFWEDYYMLIYTHCWELMNSVGSHGSSTAVRDEGDGLSLCEPLSWGYDCTHCRVTFNCCCGDFSATSSIFYVKSECTGF